MVQPGFVIPWSPTDPSTLNIAFTKEGTLKSDINGRHRKKNVQLAMGKWQRTFKTPKVTCLRVDLISRSH
jgi:hypothetical protein